jgi:hypothetical protein
MKPPPTKLWRILRRGLTGLGVCLILIGLFYAEEDWRGDRAWKNCKRALQAQGAKLDWADFIPAQVPEDDNVFGVPEMQKWFVAGPAGEVAGWQASELAEKMSYPGYEEGSRTARLVVARLTICLPGASLSANSGATVLQWGKPQARAEAARIIKEALGPVVTDPAGFNLMLRSPEEIRPAQIFLQCQTAPTAEELRQFLPEPIANTADPDSEKIQVEPAGNGCFVATMLAPDTVAKFLEWNEQLEPDFALIRRALQRPYVRINGDYSSPLEIPAPNVVAVHHVSQRLAVMAQCHLAQGKPEEALRDLTLLHDLCRILEGSRPMTLLPAFMNAAFQKFYVDTIAEGLRQHAWREPQLAVLEEQLKQINLLLPLKQSVETERATYCYIMERQYPPLGVRHYVLHFFTLDSWRDRLDDVLETLNPRGWVNQNLVAGVNLFTNAIGALDPASQLIFPDKAAAAIREANEVDSEHYPYTLSPAFMITNYLNYCQTTARNQTIVNQALAACALERFHLEHGEYPDTLAPLAPRFLAAIPHDVIGGQPLHYRRAADGTFVLYSVGWNGRDGGGTRGKTVADGDWVWPFFDP